jgi:hypothetical protein
MFTNMADYSLDGVLVRVVRLVKLCDSVLVQRVRTDLTLKHGFNVFSSLVDAALGLVLEPRDLIKSVSDLVSDHTSEQVRQFVRRPHFESLLSQRDDRTFARSGRLQAGKWGAFTGPVHTHNRPNQTFIWFVQCVRTDNINRLMLQSDLLPVSRRRTSAFNHHLTARRTGSHRAGRTSAGRCRGR